MTESMTISIRPLQLGAMRDPSAPGRQILVFGDTGSAIAHLRDHLLTAPECDAWALVLPHYCSVLDPADGKARLSYCDAMMELSGKGQSLYDLYRAAIGEASEDAATLGWFCSEGRMTVAIGTTGLLLVVDGVLKTAFLPGQGSPEATRQARDGNEEPTRLPRESGMRSGRPGRWKVENEKETRDRERREAAWPLEVKLYYRVFRPAVQFVKQCNHRNRDILGEWHRQDYALLKDVLPARSELKLDQWKALRQTCGRGVKP